MIYYPQNLYTGCTMLFYRAVKVTSNHLITHHGLPYIPWVFICAALHCRLQSFISVFTRIKPTATSQASHIPRRDQTTKPASTSATCRQPAEFKGPLVVFLSIWLMLSFYIGYVWLRVTTVPRDTSFPCPTDQRLTLSAEDWLQTNGFSKSVVVDAVEMPSGNHRDGCRVTGSWLDPKTSTEITDFVGTFPQSPRRPSGRPTGKMSSYSMALLQIFWPHTDWPQDPKRP